MSDVKMLRLGGADFPVPRLAARQMRSVVPAIITLLKEFGPGLGTILAMKNGTTSPNIVTLLSSLPFNEDQLGTLMEKIVFPAVKRGSDNMTIDAFLDLPIGVQDLMEALPVVMMQTGLLADPTETTDGAKPGEVPPAGGLTTPPLAMPTS